MKTIWIIERGSEESRDYLDSVHITERSAWLRMKELILEDLSKNHIMIWRPFVWELKTNKHIAWSNLFEHITAEQINLNDNK